MSVTSHFDSAVFNRQKLRQAVASFIIRQTKDFKNLSKRRMIDSQASGRLHRRKNGVGFTRSHRASARGQRPAIDTGKLLNSINDRRIGDFSRIVSADAEYAPYLQSERLGRRIMMTAIRRKLRRKRIAKATYWRLVGFDIDLRS